MKIVFKKNDFIIGMVLVVLVLIIACFVLFNPLVGSQGSKVIEKQQAQQNQPKQVEDVNGSIQLISITMPNCEKCIDFSPFIKSIKRSYNVDSLKDVVFDSKKGQELIKKYSITKVPTLVVDGTGSQIIGLSSQWNAVGTIESDGVLIFRKVPPVFFDLSEQKFKGIVSMTLIVDKNCTECSHSLGSKELTEKGIIIGSEELLDLNDKKAIELIKKYSIKKAPALILSSEIQDYPFFENFKIVGTLEDDNSFVLREVDPLYVDIASRKVKGYVDAVFVVDSNCTECLNPLKLKAFFETKFLIKFNSFQSFDFQKREGKDLVKKYSIKKLPAVIFSNDLNDYAVAKLFWSNFGTIQGEEFVFKNADAFGLKYSSVSNDLNA